MCINLEGGGLAEGDEPDYNNLPTAHIVRVCTYGGGGSDHLYQIDTGTRLETRGELCKALGRMEAISVVIDDTGIIEFNWTSPYTDFRKLLRKTTNLLPFSDDPEIRFEKMIMVKYSYVEEGALQLDIKSVHLGLMRVTNPEQRDSGLLIPAVGFFRYNNDDARK